MVQQHNNINDWILLHDIKKAKRQKKNFVDYVLCVFMHGDTKKLGN